MDENEPQGKTESRNVSLHLKKLEKEQQINKKAYGIPWWPRVKTHVFTAGVKGSIPVGVSRPTSHTTWPKKHMSNE